MMDLFTRGLGSATDGFLAALRAHAPPPPTTTPPSIDASAAAAAILAEVRSEHDRQMRALVDLFAEQHSAALLASAAAAAAVEKIAPIAGAAMPGVTVPQKPAAADETAAYSEDFEESGVGSTSVRESLAPGDSGNSNPSPAGGSISGGVGGASAAEDSVADEVGSVLLEDEVSSSAAVATAHPTPAAAVAAADERPLAAAKAGAAAVKNLTPAVASSNISATTAMQYSIESSSVGEESAAAAVSADLSVSEDDIAAAASAGSYDVAPVTRNFSNGFSALASGASEAAASVSAGVISSAKASDEIEDEVPSVVASSMGSDRSPPSDFADSSRRKLAPATVGRATDVGESSAEVSAGAYTEDFEEVDSGGGGSAAEVSSSSARKTSAASVAAAAVVSAGNGQGAVEWEVEEDGEWGGPAGLLLLDAPPELAGDPATAAALSAVRRSLREEGVHCREQLALLRMRESAADEAAAAELARVGEALRRMVAAGGGAGGEDLKAAAEVRRLDERDRRVRLRLAAERSELARLRAEARSETLRRQLMLYEQVPLCLVSSS